MTSGKIFNKIQRSVGKKGSENTEELSKALMEELNCETAFTIYLERKENVIFLI